jgi:GTPase
VGGRICVNFEPVLHVHTMRQTAKIVAMDREDGLGKGDSAVCRFRLLYRPEYVSEGMTIVLRAGRTLGIGRVLAVMERKADGL